ncbi:MAG TPA: HAD family phosphatase [Peptococcaceae bacterium]|nr:HAD family phosphatase [Peptococcaceae bacterium]
MIKLIATDLDGTLLTEDWRISPRNIQAVRQALAQGIKVTLATGRMAAATRGYARELGLDVPLITYHGALIEQAGSGEVLYRKVVPVDLAAEIVEYLLRKDIHNQIFLKDRVFVRKANKYSEFYSRMAGLKVEEADFAKLLAKEPEGVEKILCIGEKEVLQRAKEELKETYGEKLHFTSSSDQFMDMLHPEVNKGTALKALAEQWGIEPGEVMALGDSINDKEMLTYAGLGVAMGNAHPELKKIAGYITAPYWEDGVAQAIEKFCFKQV